MMTGGEFRIGNNQRDIGNFERQMELESDEVIETRKYIKRDDYK